MATDYNYDESGNFFPYFVLSVASIVTIPLSLHVFNKTKASASTKTIESGFIPEQDDLIRKQKKKQRVKEFRTKRTVAAAIGWLLMGAMIFLIWTTPAGIAAQIWNPYDILGISESATVKQINSHYKKMALKFHPDKIRPSENQTIEDLNNHFVEISKAYKALTDEDIRRNFIEFGHPDGKQSYSIGIALPPWILSDVLLLIYAVAFGIVLPWTVGSWWYTSQKHSKDKILLESANELFKQYQETMDEGDILSAVTVGIEFDEVVKQKKVVSKLNEEKVVDIIEKLKLSAKDLATVKGLEGTRQMTLVLLWSYLWRLDLGDSTLNEAKFAVAVIARSLNSAFVNMTLAFGNTAPIFACYRVTQALIQAIPFGQSALLQLPYVSPEVAQAIENDAHPKTIQQFVDLKNSRAVATGAGLTNEQYGVINSVTSQLPLFKVEKASFKVVGESHVTVGSLVSLVIKGAFAPPGSGPLKEVEDEKETEKDEAEKADDEFTNMPPLHAPYYTGLYSPRILVFLTDSKQDKLVIPPFTFATFELPIFEDSGKPTLNIQTLQAQFQAPPQAGQYTFVLHVISDSYSGFDSKLEVVLNVDEVGKADVVVEEDEISEPDEDSLAGQLQAMKGAAPPSKKKKVVDDDDSSDEDQSGTEEEEDDVSETDTDTDEE